MSLYERTVSDDMVLQSLVPGAKWHLIGTQIEFVETTANGLVTVTTPNLNWLDNEIEKPTKDEILAERTRIQAELNSTLYQRKRQPEYPPLGELADAIYWQNNGDDTKMTAYLAKVQAVKDKYPKPTE
jgi:hypothetical protein